MGPYSKQILHFSRWADLRLTKLRRSKQLYKSNIIWKHTDGEFTLKKCGRSVERFLYSSSSARNVPSGEERGETDVFAGYSFQYPYCRAFEARRVQKILGISTLKVFLLLLKNNLLWKIWPISVKRWKPEWIRPCTLQKESCCLFICRIMDQFKN